MFEISQKCRVHIPYLEQEGQEHYAIIKQWIERPVWFVDVTDLEGPPEDQEVSAPARFMADEASYAVQIALARPWVDISMWVLLPYRMSDPNIPRLTKCHAIWSAKIDNEESNDVWYFDTDLGTFTTHLSELEPEKLLNKTCRWQA